MGKNDKDKQEIDENERDDDMEAIKITTTNKQCNKEVDRKKRDNLYAFLTTKNKDIYSKLAK